MMRRSRKKDQSEPGYDSFLDVVANLVGVMIILVMVVGAGAKEAMVQAQLTDVELPQVEPDTEPIDVQSARVAAESLENDILALDAKKRDLSAVLASRNAERAQIEFLLEAAAQKLEQESQELSASQQLAYQREKEIADAARTLQEIQRRQQFALRSKPKTNYLEHIPTPIAKTVFGQEAHFRLKGGKLAHIPWDELVSLLEKDAPDKVWKLRNGPSMSEIVGPVEGWRLRYTLIRDAVRNDDGVVISQNKIVFDNFVVAPLTDDTGETIEQALRPQSVASRALAKLDAKRTTITVWVYPDSFGDYRTVKKHFYDLGFLTASRPLPAGMPITASTGGTRSVTQ